MTTERRADVPRTSPLELRLYLTALLAAVYTITWRAVGGPAAATEPAVATAPATTEPRVVWIDSLSPARQPAVPVPRGWVRASDGRTAAAPAAPVRIAPRRVRTRSS